MIAQQLRCTDPWHAPIREVLAMFGAGTRDRGPGTRRSAARTFPEQFLMDPSVVQPRRMKIGTVVESPIRIPGPGSPVPGTGTHLPTGLIASAT